VLGKADQRLDRRIQPIGQERPYVPYGPQLQIEAYEDAERTSSTSRKLSLRASNHASQAFTSTVPRRQTRPHRTAW
jgi:hypothetical protein